mmetsp:Transcript_107616/g.321843  ORF Transcript_107616/g.321843 Transcript_107616/m.321843 type:complete len:151 (+) Transcript_107616:80-532(+)
MHHAAAANTTSLALVLSGILASHPVTEGISDVIQCEALDAPKSAPALLQRKQMSGSSQQQSWTQVRTRPGAPSATAPLMLVSLDADAVIGERAQSAASVILEQVDKVNPHILWPLLGLCVVGACVGWLATANAVQTGSCELRSPGRRMGG